MNEVSKENANNCVSGGFIFDQMDRFAHDYLKKMYKVKGFLLTIVASVSYIRQVCDWDSVDVVVSNHYYDENDATYCIYTNVVDKKNNTVYASAYIEFIEKDHAYCDTKGENNESFKFI